MTRKGFLRFPRLHPVGTLKYDCPSSEAWPQLLEDGVSIRKSDINVGITKCLIATSCFAQGNNRGECLHSISVPFELIYVALFSSLSSAKLCPALLPCRPSLANTVGAQGELITERKWSTTPRGRPFFWDADTEKHTDAPSP